MEKCILTIVVLSYFFFFRVIRLSGRTVCVGHTNTFSLLCSSFHVMLPVLLIS